MKIRSQLNINGINYERYSGKQKVFSAETISDANIDILGCFYINNNIEGFGVCEWNNRNRYDPDSTTSYGNNLVTNVKDRSFYICKEIMVERSKPKKFIYIEFMFSDQGFNDIVKAYTNIHKATVDILNNINMSNVLLIHIYRLW